MNKKTVIGGQAVIEGVMMKGPNSIAVAVRQPNGEIAIEEEPLTSLGDRYPILKKPILRGVVALGEALVYGMKALSKSARLSGADDEDEITSKEMFITMASAIILAIGLFIVLPTWLAKYLSILVADKFWFNLLEGIIRLVIFLTYVTIISRVDDIQRVFQYHGAEHKTIFAYEADLELKVENIRGFSTLHPRCGTSFLLIVMVISIVVFGFLGWPDFWQRVLSRILLMPIIAGLSYEVTRFAGRNCDTPWVKVLIMPGLMLQKLTTKEPDDQQIEVAIAALQAVLPREHTDNAVVEEEKIAV